MTHDALKERAMRKIAERRGVPFDPNDTSLLHGLRYADIAAFTEYGVQYLRQLKCEGVLKPERDSFRGPKQFEFGEVARAMKTIGYVI